jgi:hypothetical protein
MAKQEKARIPGGEKNKAGKSTVTTKDDEAKLKRLARERRRSSRGRTSGAGMSATRRKSLVSGPGKNRR